MNRTISLAITILVLLVVNVLSQGPDELYVQIYEIIQAADNFNQSGDGKQALSKYLEAKSALEKFQQNFPQWNPNIIKYRLEFLADKIAGLEKYQQKTTPTPEQPQQPAKTALPQPTREIPKDIKDQIDFLQQQISQLKIERDQLQVKLKEALSVQPAAVDPGELTRANEKIRNLEKQVELLQIAVNQEREKSSKLIEPAAFNAVQKALAEATEKLELQTKELSLLSRQKEEVEKALKEEKAKSLSKSNKKEIEELQKQIDNLNKELKERDQLIASLKKEKDDLKLKYSSKVDNALISENENLKKQIEELKKAAAPEQAESIKKEISSTREELNVLKGKYEALKIEKELVDARLKNSNNQTGVDIDSRLKEMQNQLSALIKENAAKEAKIQGLIAEKEALEKSLKDRKQIKEDDESIKIIKNLENELAIANGKVNDLSKKLESITKEKSDLEKQLVALASDQKSTKGSRDKDIKRIKELEKENEELQKKLNAISKDYYSVQQKNQTIKLSELENQVVALKARLEAYEIKAIPHTPEEIELMTKTELVKVSPEGIKPRKVAELSPEASKILVDAQADIESGKLTQAESKLQEVLKYDSSHLSTLFRLASVQLEQNRLDEAERTINKALSVDPDDAGALFLLGVLNDQRGRLNESIEAFSRSVKSNPDNPDTQVYLGIVLSKKGLRPQAETAFRKALQIQPKNSRAHINLAVIYATQNPPFIELAKWHYQRAIDNGAERNPELEKKLYPSTENK